MVRVLRCDEFGAKPRQRKFNALAMRLARTFGDGRSFSARRLFVRLFLLKFDVLALKPPRHLRSILHSAFQAACPGVVGSPARRWSRGVTG